LAWADDTIVKRVEAPEPKMNYSLSRIRWLRVFGAALSVIALSFISLMIITAGYAAILAFQARGSPDQNTINRFAAGMSPRLMPWLEIIFTLIVSFRVARTTEEHKIIHGLFIGILAGLLGLAVALFIRGHVSLHSLVIFLCVAGLGWLGGFCGQKWAAK
jgi:hypothetical protein